MYHNPDKLALVCTKHWLSQCLTTSLLILLLGFAFSIEASELVALNAAEYVVDDGEQPPNNSAAWQPIELS